MRRANSTLTFGNYLQLFSFLVVALLFVFGNNSGVKANEKSSVANSHEIAVNQNKLDAHEQKIEELRNVSIMRDGEMINVKGELKYHGDILKSIAHKVGAVIPIKDAIK